MGNENSPARAYPRAKACGFTALAYFGEFSGQKFSALKGGAYTLLHFCDIGQPRIFLQESGSFLNCKKIPFPCLLKSAALAGSAKPKVIL